MDSNADVSDKLRKLNSSETSIYLKLCLVVVCILSFRASIDYFGLWGYIIAFGLGALWMFTTLVGIAGVYGYMNLDQWLGEYVICFRTGLTNKGTHSDRPITPSQQNSFRTN